MIKFKALIRVISALITIAILVLTCFYPLYIFAGIVVIFAIVIVLMFASAIYLGIEQVLKDAVDALENKGDLE